MSPPRSVPRPPATAPDHSGTSLEGRSSAPQFSRVRLSQELRQHLILVYLAVDWAVFSIDKIGPISGALPFSRALLALGCAIGSVSG